MESDRHSLSVAISNIDLHRCVVWVEVKVRVGVKHVVEIVKVRFRG